MVDHGWGGENAMRNVWVSGGDTGGKGRFRWL